MKKKIGVLFLLALLLVSAGGCKLEASRLWQANKSNQPELIKVMIYFTDNQTVIGYVDDLGMDKSSKIYTGGSSVNYLYDKEGKVTGCFNFQRVLYMKILRENEKN